MDENLETLFYQSEIGKIIYTLVVEYSIMNKNATYNTMVDYYTHNRTYDLYDDDDLFTALHEDIFLALDFIEQSYYQYYGTHIFLYEIQNPSDLISILLFFVFNEFENEIS